MEGLSNSLHCCNYLADPIIEWDCQDAFLFLFLYFMLLYFLIAEFKMVLSAEF